MADCAPLLDEELSSFVFSYLTENSGSQVRPRPLWIHGTLGYPTRGASERVAGGGARNARLMRGSRPACQQHLHGSARPGVSVCVRVCVCECLLCLDVWLSRVFWRKCHQPWAVRESDGLKRKYVLVSVLEAESSRCVAAPGGLFGMQRGALETFDAILREVLISALETWTRGAHLNAWTWPEDYYDIVTL